MYNPAASSIGTPIEGDLQPPLPVGIDISLVEACLTLLLGSATPSHFPHPHHFPTHQNLSHLVAKMYLQTVHYNTSLSCITSVYDFPFLRIKSQCLTKEHNLLCSDS